jgi:hypothetical protein
MAQKLQSRAKVSMSSTTQPRPSPRTIARLSTLAMLICIHTPNAFAQALPDAPSAVAIPSSSLPDAPSSSSAMQIDIAPDGHLQTGPNGELLTPPSPDNDTSDELQKKWVVVEGIVRIDNDMNPNDNGKLSYNLRSQKTEFEASIRVPKVLPEWVAKQLLFVVRSKMEQDVIINGMFEANHLKVSDYLKEAYLEFKNVGGLPVVVVVGSTETTFGQDYEGTLDYQNDASHAMTDPDRGQVKGFTVALNKDILHIFDKVEAGFFTSDPQLTHGGLAHFDGFSFRVSKAIGKYLSIQSSALHKGNGYNSDLKPETDISFGGIYHRGVWTFWGEGVKMIDAEAYPTATMGVTGGASRVTGPGQINVEATDIKGAIKQYAAGYELFLSKNWTVGSTFRYTFCVGGNQGCVDARGYGQGASVGVTVKYQFGREEDLNPNWLRKKGKQAVRNVHLQMLDPHTHHQHHAPTKAIN